LSDTWLTAKIFMNRWEDKPEIVTRLIAPIVRGFEKEIWFKTFHFLSYASEQEGVYLRFRVSLSSEKKGFLRESIERKKNDVNASMSLITSIDYDEQYIENPNVKKGEQDRFGPTGLPIFLKYLEYVSRTTIGLLERPKMETVAYPIKYRMTLELFHFLLNTLLYPSFDGDGEILAHIEAIKERHYTASLQQSLKSS